jgi:hypothetical protein
MDALVHLSGPVLPRRLDFVAIHHSMKCVKTMSTTDIGNVFLFLYTASSNVQYVPKTF